MNDDSAPAGAPAGATPGSRPAAPAQPMFPKAPPAPPLLAAFGALVDWTVVMIGAVMILLEGDKPLGADAHKYYDELVDKLEADTKHVEHVQDFWGDPLTAAGAGKPQAGKQYIQSFTYQLQ